MELLKEVVDSFDRMGETAVQPEQHLYGEKRMLGASQEVVELFDQREKRSYNLNSIGTM